MVLLCQIIGGIGVSCFYLYSYLAGRFVLIFHFNCEHVLFVYIVKQTHTKFLGFYTKNFVDFQNFQKSNFVRSKSLKVRSSINLPRGHARSHKKFGLDRFSCIGVYWIHTNRETTQRLEHRICFSLIIIMNYDPSLSMVKSNIYINIWNSTKNQISFVFEHSLLVSLES